MGSEPTSDAAIHLQRAAKELIAALRSFLDAAEEVVDDGDLVAEATGALRAFARDVTQGRADTGHPFDDWLDDTPDDDDPDTGGSGDAGAAGTDAAEADAAGPDTAGEDEAGEHTAGEDTAGEDEAVTARPDPSGTAAPSGHRRRVRRIDVE